MFDIGSREVCCCVEEILDLVGEQEVFGRIGVERRCEFRMRFFEPLERERSAVGNAVQCKPGRIELFLGIGSGALVILCLSIGDDNLCLPAPSSGAAKALHKACPRGELCNDDGRGHVYAGLYYLRRNDNAVGAWIARGTTQELFSPILALVGPETAMNETDIGIPESFLFAQRFIDFDGPVDTIDDYEGGAVAAFTLIKVGLSCKFGKRCRVLHRFNSKRLLNIVP